MKVPYMNLGQQPAGTVVEVIMQGGEAFVEVLDENNLGLLTDGQVHTYFGGPINGTFQCTLPTTGIWYVLGVSTAGPTQAQIFTTAPTPNSAPLPWAQDTQPIELQNGEVPEAPPEDSGIGGPTSMTAEFRNVAIGRLDRDRAKSAADAGMIAADNLVTVGPSHGNVPSTGDAPGGPFSGTLNWPSTGDDPVTFSGNAQSGVIKPKTAPPPNQFERVLTSSGTQIAGRNLFFGQDVNNGGVDFSWDLTRIIDADTNQDVLNLPKNYRNLTAAQDQSGRIYAVGDFLGAGRKLWSFNTYEEFTNPANWSIEGSTQVIQPGDREAQIIQLINPSNKQPYWALFEAATAADGKHGLTYRIAESPESLATAQPHILLDDNMPDRTLIDEGPLGRNIHGIPDSQARPGLPGIPVQEGWLPQNYGVNVHQLDNGDIVLLTSQWVWDKDHGGEKIENNLYRVVQYNIRTHS